MNINFLVNSVDYKKVFNCIYKNYLIKRSDQFNKTSIINLDLYFRKLYLNFKNIKNFKDSNDKVIKVRCIDSNVVDIYLLDNNTKNSFELNFLSDKDLCGVKIDNGIKMSHEDLLCHLFWDLMCQKNLLE
jgi:hypothetical protein